ncbi:MAG: RNA-binding S4 domain-containing protein [Thermohalobaculum sp.]|nr:RNA-binding S4 domain-containing protein [Thermohalobaculum sp.]
MGAAPEPEDRLRVDKWLWQARFLRSRALAAELAGSGRLRINGVHCAKPAQTVRPGDVLTFPQGARIRVIRVDAIGVRRGPAPEAATLYTDLDPPEARPEDAAGADVSPPGARDPGTGRPTKRARREIDMLRRNGP